MEEFRNPVYAAEPYEESQGRDDSSVTSPDALAAFYKDMEVKETVERKLSKRKSNSGTSIWSRKSVKRSATAHPAPQPIQQRQPPKQDKDYRKEKGRGKEVMEKTNHQDSDKPDLAPPINSSRSIIPDSKELPTSYSKDAWAAVPIPSYKLRYLIHDPVGPRWYKNHHLIPRSETIPAARPPSFFSASFPPMASSTSQDRSEDVTRLPGPSRTPSSSPLPTPNSSQTRVVDKPRSRKTSQTAHDTVDLLDVTDPWGTNWHHHSPYDIGLGNGPISADVQDVLHTRSRRSSLTAQNRGRPVAPSPLSQSTSAVHIQNVPDSGAHLPRKLSKRRTPVANIFNRQQQDPERNTVSLPTSPVETQPSTSGLPKRMSIAPPNGPPFATTQISPTKKEKRGSVLGRLVKKFSLLKKPASDSSRVAGWEDNWQHVSPGNTLMDSPLQRDFLPERHPSSEKPSPDAVKRIPPPAVDEPASVTNYTSKKADRTSPISFETPFSIGRLTVANPDSPRPEEVTPAQQEVPLPPDKEPKDTRFSSNLDHHLTPSLIHSTSPPSLGDTPPDIPEKVFQTLHPLSPPPPLPTKENAPETLPSPSPAIPCSTWVDSRPPEPPQKVPSHTVYPPPVVSHTRPHSAEDVPLPGLSGELSNLSFQVSAPPTQGYSAVSNSSVSRLSDKPQPNYALTRVRPTSVASSVPFPGAEDANLQSFAPYDNSPLSAASMLANPPTPYSRQSEMLETPASPPPLPTKPPTAFPSRQTETFRLIRSPSGNIYSSNETIVAGGQQWEVVEATDKGQRKGSTSSKDRQSRDRDSKSYDTKDRHHKDFESKDRDSRDRDTRVRDPRDRTYRDQEIRRHEKKQESRIKPNTEDEQDPRNRRRSRRESKEVLGERSTVESKTAMRINESNPRHRETNTVTANQDTKRSSRRRDGREQMPDRKQELAQPVLPPAIQDVFPSRPLGRHPSLSARPTSQLPSAEEMNAMRAKEAWDMERLWKARSMQGDELNGHTTIPSNQNTPRMGHINEAASQIYGSSHTAFVVQTPSQSQHSIYHSMPAMPPPIIYSSSSSLPTVAHQPPPTHRMSNSRIYAESMASDQTLYPSSVRRPNPPSDPTYEVPADIRSSEYWSKYATIAASH